MDLITAIKYTKNNCNLLLEEGKKVVGVSYNPNSNFENFEVFEISFNIDDFNEDGISGFDIMCNGEPEWYGTSYNEIRNTIPQSAINLNYEVFKAGSFCMIETYFILKELFPELPDPATTEFISSHDFENKASLLVNKLNN
ncbi:hypothetical protein [Colwellia sp. MB3u-55]|jgi:hypothetical protein|uniref:hypothetical protein n=1 Tax=Colwellia sp. MB3u-55 TaxID=2759810 RepID=UPI0015F37CEA|nr:hypothetical protein [Colwellia sp. MB3u-55]MBA6253650.1 hypothetical protein [Colwellia sp. MB3u-55]